MIQFIRLIFAANLYPNLLQLNSVLYQIAKNSVFRLKTEIHNGDTLHISVHDMSHEELRTFVYSYDGSSEENIVSLLERVLAEDIFPYLESLQLSVTDWMLEGKYYQALALSNNIQTKALSLMFLIPEEDVIRFAHGLALEMEGIRITNGMIMAVFHYYQSNDLFVRM